MGSVQYLFVHIGNFMAFLKKNNIHNETNSKNKTDNFYSYVTYQYLEKRWYKLDYNFYAFKEFCFFIKIDTCSADFRQIPMFFDQIKKERGDSTFYTFVQNTNEKKQTEQIFSSFLNDYSIKFTKLLQSVSVVDLGVGEGTLSSSMARYLKAQCEELTYEGIDKSSNFTELTTQKFLTLDVKDHKFIVGDIFGGDVDKLIDHPTLLIASQVVFYAPDIGEFIDLIIKKMGAIAFVIGQADHSFLNIISKNYAGADLQKDVETKVTDALKTHVSEANFVNILYSSSIDFPKIESLKEVAYSCFDCFDNPKKLIARKLLEFMSGVPLEQIEYEGKLDEFIESVTNHTIRIDGNIQFWNFMQIIVPRGHDQENQLNKTVQAIYTEKFSGKYTELGKAVLEGRENIIKSMLQTGISVTDITPKHIIPIWKNILFYSRFAPILSMIVDKDIPSNTTAFNLYINALKEEDYRVNNVLWEDINNKLTQDNFIKIHDYLDNFIKSFDQESNSANLFASLIIRNIIGIASISFNRLLIRNGDAVFVDLKKTLICSTGILYSSIYSYYTHYSTEYKLAHYLASQGEIDIFTKLSHYDFFYNTFNIQSGSGKTALHYAAKSNSSIIAKQIMMYDFVKVNIADYSGYLPIHYAAEKGNLELIAKFLNNYEISINATVGGEVGKFKSFMNGMLLFSSAFCIRYIPAFSYGDFDPENQWVADKIIFDGLHYVLMGLDLGKRIYFGIPDKISQIFFPHYTKEELQYESRYYRRYSQDSLLHLSTKNNYTDLSLWLIKNQNISRSKNIDGIYPIHNAAASLNIELLQKLTELDPDSINYVAIRDNGPLYSWQYNFLIYTHLTFTLERPYMFNNVPHYLPHIMNMLMQTVFWPIFSIEGSPFDQSKKEFGSTLHFAAAGTTDTHSLIAQITSSKYINNATITPEKDWIKYETLKFLIEQGVEVDKSITYQYYPFLEGVTLAFFLGNQFLIQQFNIYRFVLPKIENFLPQNIFGFLENIFRPDMDFPAYFRIHYFHVNIVTLLYYFFGRHTEQFKAIDLVEKCLSNQEATNIQLSESYKLLKQYTSVKLNKDAIYIKEYGSYKNEKNEFTLTKNFDGKKEGYKIIIKNYQGSDKIILDESFGILDISTIQYKTTLIMNKSSTIVTLETGEEIVTLYNYVSNKINIRPLLSSFFSTHKQTWWDNTFGYNKIELNSSNNIYSSNIKHIHFKVMKEESNNENILSILNFDCKTKDQVLDFSEVDDIQKLEDIELELINNSVLVKNKVTQQELVLLEDIDLYQLSGRCFYFGNEDALGIREF